MANAMAGYQAFVLEYSVASRAPAGKALFPAQIIDFGKAILTIREHAEEWHVDVEKISIIGFSAGAHLCGMLATGWHEPLLSETFGCPATYFKPLTAMLIYGLLDYNLQESLRGAEGTITLPAAINVPVFGTEVPDDEQLAAYSPVRKVTEHTPPVFMAAAADDAMVCPLHSLRMAQSLHAAGVPYELHIYEYGGHGFSLGRNLIEPYRHDKAHACAEWLHMAKLFLMRHIAPETTEYEKNPFKAMFGG